MCNNQHLIDVMAKFRNGSLKDVEQIHSLSTFTVGEEIRGLVKLEDWTYIKDWLILDQDPFVRFAHMLLRNLLKEVGVKEFLLQLYETSKHPINKIGLLYDLLEYEDISMDNRLYFLQFLEDNHEVYQNYELEWYENESALFEAIRSRLKLIFSTTHLSHNITAGKVWIYLYNLSLLHQNKKAALDFAEKCRGQLDRFSDHVLEIVIDKYLKRQL